MESHKNSNKKRNSYNVLAVTMIAKRFGFSTQYIRQCIRGDKKSISADIISKEYFQLVKKIEKLI